MLKDNSLTNSTVFGSFVITKLYNYSDYDSKNNSPESGGAMVSPEAG